MARKKPASSVEEHFNYEPNTGKRIGFNVSPDTARRFEEMAEHYGVSNKDLFVAMVQTTYEEFKQ